MDRTVTLNYDQLVKITCKMSDNPEMIEKRINQGFLEYLLVGAVNSVTNVDFFECERMMYENVITKIKKEELI